MVKPHWGKASKKNLINYPTIPFPESIYYKRFKMRHIKHYLVAITGLLAISISLSSCLKDVCDETLTFIQYDPIYLNYDQIRVDIKSEEGRELNNPGNIYSYKNYLLINEIREGIHVYDNTDPTNPVNLAFISIPGNVDMAIQDDVLFADNYMDVISIDISDPLNPILQDREEDVYQEYWFQEGRGFQVGYRETERTQEVDCSSPNWGNQFFWDGNVFFAETAFDAAANNVGGATSQGAVGTGGSLARFTLAKNHLYVIDQWNLFSFSIEQGSTLSLVSDFSVGWGIETIYPYGDNLFIGSQTGMFIYDISTPGSPLYQSEFTHARACDPVFVSGDRAYVTLRDGNRCANFNNQLDVLNVSDLRNPTLITTHQMDNPHGLSKIENKLIICEGDYGLKTFDASNDMEIRSNILDHIKDISAYDVIALSLDQILVVGKDGLFQYDASKDDLELISTISVNRK